MAQVVDLRIDTDVVSTKALNMYSISYRFENLLRANLMSFDEMDIVWKGTKHDEFMKEFRGLAEQLLVETKALHEFLVTQRRAAESYSEMENEVADVANSGIKAMDARG